MKFPAVKYARAVASQEAVELLQEYGDEAKLLAGGQSLLPLLGFRLAHPTVLVDLNPAADLEYVREDNGSLLIGAMTRQRTLETSQVVRRTVPLLAEALRHVGHVTIRNRGTLGGSLAHADPAAELPTAILALDGELLVDSPSGQRTIQALEFFRGPFTTALGADEVLAAVRLPRLEAGTGVAVEELARRRGDFAIVVVAAAVRLDSGGRCEAARIAVGGAQSVPLRAVEAESILVGEEPTESTMDAAADAVAAAVRPLDDVHAPGWYRRDMTRIYVERALRSAMSDARG